MAPKETSEMIWSKRSISWSCLFWWWRVVWVLCIIISSLCWSGLKKSLRVWLGNSASESSLSSIFNSYLIDCLRVPLCLTECVCHLDFKYSCERSVIGLSDNHCIAGPVYIWTSPLSPVTCCNAVATLYSRLHLKQFFFIVGHRYSQSTVCQHFHIGFWLSM